MSQKMILQEGQENQAMWDPMRGEWFFRFIDPRDLVKKEDKVVWLRIVLTLVFIWGPLWLFSTIHSKTFGGNLLGKGSLTADIGIYAMLFLSAFTLILIPLMRRKLDKLIQYLLSNRITDPVLINFNPATSHKGLLLRSLEKSSKIAGVRGLLWCLLFTTFNLYMYYTGLVSGKPVWNVTPADQETFFYAFKIGNQQPNLAGLWFFTLVSPVCGYLVMLIIRSVIVFACLCSDIANDEQLSIVPLHADGVGGLQPIGKVAFINSLFAFSIGIAIAGMTTNALIVNFVFKDNSIQMDANMWSQLIMWVLYLVFGTLLFFLPLLPLRARMAEAKECYLKDAIKQQVAAELRHRTELQENKFEPDSLQGLSALNNLIRTADEMAVWPFDRKTFLRFASLLISPLTPLMAGQLPRIVAGLKSYLGLYK